MRKSVNYEPTQTFSIRVTVNSLNILDAICEEYEIPRNELIVASLRMYGNWSEQVLINPMFEEAVYGKEGMTPKQRQKHARLTALKDITNQPEKKTI